MWFTRTQPVAPEPSELDEHLARLGWKWDRAQHKTLCTHCGCESKSAHNSDCVWLNGSPFIDEYT